MQHVSTHKVTKIRTRRIFPRRLTPYFLLIPALLLMALVVFYPIVYAVFLSFQKYSLLEEADSHFVGLDNFARALSDPLFWESAKNTVLWVLGVVPAQLVFGLAVAVLLNRDFKGRAAVRAIVLIPWVIPGVLNALMWRWMYDGNYGVINDILEKLHLTPNFIPFLAQPGTALPAIIVTTIWQGTPFFAIMLLAALQSVPLELYDAAKIDGASPVQEFRFITIPGILPTIIITTLLRTIWVANYIEVIFIMTGGGPGYSSTTLPVYTFLVAYNSLDFGYASALSLFLVFLLAIVVTLYAVYLRKAEIKLR